MSIDVRRPVLECQDCGEVLRELTDALAQQVALRPYDHVAYCAECRRLRRLTWDGEL